MGVSPMGARLADLPGIAMTDDLPPDLRARALEFQRELDDSLATRVESQPWGAAIFRDDLPRAVDLNLLRIEPAGSALDAVALMAEADTIQAGLPHRAVRVLEAAAAARLAPDFGAAGWLLRRTALMVQRRMRDRPVDSSAVQELGLHEIHAARQATVRREHRDIDTGADVLAAGELESDGTAPRAFAAVAGSEVAAYCMLRVKGDVAKLTEAEALARSSGRGVGRAVIAEAVLAARRDGAKLVFVETEDEDWAKWTYHRMGFDEAGKLYLFVRPWGD